MGTLFLKGRKTISNDTKKTLQPPHLRFQGLIYYMALTALLKRDTFLEALFLWYTPFVHALSISEVAFTKHACAAALSPAAIAASTFLIEVFTFDLIALFLAVLVSVTKILFLADLILANLGTSD